MEGLNVWMIDRSRRFLNLDVLLDEAMECVDCDVSQILTIVKIKALSLILSYYNIQGRLSHLLLPFSVLFKPLASTFAQRKGQCVVVFCKQLILFFLSHFCAVLVVASYFCLTVDSLNRSRIPAVNSKINPAFDGDTNRSEERRVGKECDIPCRSRWSPYH